MRRSKSFDRIVRIMFQTHSFSVERSPATVVQSKLLLSSRNHFPLTAYASPKVLFKTPNPTATSTSRTSFGKSGGGAGRFFIYMYMLAHSYTMTKSTDSTKPTKASLLSRTDKCRASWLETCRFCGCMRDEQREERLRRNDRGGGG